MPQGSANAALCQTISAQQKMSPAMGRRAARAANLACKTANGNHRERQAALIHCLLKNGDKGALVSEMARRLNGQSRGRHCRQFVAPWRQAAGVPRNAPAGVRRAMDDATSISTLP